MIKKLNYKRRTLYVIRLWYARVNEDAADT